ncbi:MAG TPA: hypothetical protein VIK91_10085 [Nannocystis sp.]
MSTQPEARELPPASSRSERSSARGIVAGAVFVLAAGGALLVSQSCTQNPSKPPQIETPTRPSPDQPPRPEQPQPREQPNHAPPDYPPPVT